MSHINNLHKNNKSSSNGAAHYHKSEQLNQHAHLTMPAFSCLQSLKVRLLVQLQTYTQDAAAEACALEAMPALSQTQPAGNFMLAVDPDTSISQLLKQISARPAQSKAALRCTHLFVEGIFQVDASFTVRDALTDMQRITVLATQTNAQNKKKNKKSQKPPQVQPIQEASQPTKRQKLNNKQSKTLEYSDIEELNSSLSSEIESDIILPATTVNTTSAKNHKKQPTQSKQSKQVAPVVAAKEVKETKNQKKKRERKEKAKLEAQQNKQKTSSLSSSHGLEDSSDQKEEKNTEKKHAKTSKSSASETNKESKKPVADNKKQELSSDLSEDEEKQMSQASKKSSFIETIAKSINSYDLVKAHSDAESQRRASASGSELEVSLKKAEGEADQQSNKSSYNFSSDEEELPKQKHSDLNEASYQSSLESSKHSKVKTPLQKTSTQTPEKKHNSLSSDLEDGGEFDEFLKLDKNKNKSTKAPASKSSSAVKPSDKKQKKYPNLF